MEVEAPLSVPLAVLPAVVSILAVLGVVGSTGGLTILELLRRHFKQHAQLTRRISQTIRRRSGDFAKRIASSDFTGGADRRALLGGSILALIAGRLLQRFVRAMRASLAIMNPCDTVMDVALREKLDGVVDTWGKGLPRPPEAGQWRRYLMSNKGARENLEEMHGMLGLVKRPPREMTLEQMTVGVRRLLRWKYNRLPLVTERFWSEADARTIAEGLAAECGLRDIQEKGGLEECGSTDGLKNLPFETPKWLQVPQRYGIAAMRLVFVDTWGWASSYVDTPYGRMHIYDTGPANSGEGQPPLLLQHGMFVTGWSMSLVAWLLSRRGRRVIVPDLFDYDHGLSASNQENSLYKPQAFREALMCVLRKLESEGTSEVDIAGHSFGGFMAAYLEKRCQHENIKVRRLIMLGPGGGMFDCLHPEPMASRFMQDPMGTVDLITPRWFPTSITKFLVRTGMGVLFSPNNCNLFFGPLYDEYLGYPNLGTDTPTLLLWGDLDNVASPRRLEYLEEFTSSNYPHLDAFWVTGGSHNIQVDAALSVSEVIDAWLRSPEADVGSGSWKVPAGSHGRWWPTSRKLYKMDLKGAAAGEATNASIPLYHNRSRL